MTALFLTPKRFTSAIEDPRHLRAGRRQAPLGACSRRTSQPLDMESSNGGETTEHTDARAYSVIKREGQDDYWLNLGLAFPHKDGAGFNIILQAFPFDGKIVCREIGEEDAGEPPAQSRGRSEQPRGGQTSRRR